jgi:hypothetical protein
MVSVAILITIAIVTSLFQLVMENLSQRHFLTILLKGAAKNGTSPTHSLQNDIARQKYITMQCFIYAIVYLAVNIFPLFNMIAGTSR